MKIKPLSNKTLAIIYYFFYAAFFFTGCLYAFKGNWLIFYFDFAVGLIYAGLAALRTLKI